MAADISCFNILMVEDDDDFRIPAIRFLTRKGMTVQGVPSAEEMYPCLDSFSPDVIILDINLPGEDGFTTARKLRQISDAGIVMLTARGSLDDRVQGLTESADIYLTKPVDMRELEAALLAVCRKQRPRSQPDGQSWVFDPGHWTLTSAEGEQCELSASEHTILLKLLEQPGTPVERSILFDALGKPAAGPEDRSLDVLLSRLRRKFTSPTCPLPVKSVRGIGYVFPRPATKTPDL